MYIYIYICIYIDTYTYTYTYICIYPYLHIYLHSYLSIYLSSCIYKHIFLNHFDPYTLISTTSTSRRTEPSSPRWPRPSNSSASVPFSCRPPLCERQLTNWRAQRHISSCVFLCFCSSIGNFWTECPQLYWLRRIDGHAPILAVTRIRPLSSRIQPHHGPHANYIIKSICE